MTQRPRGTTSGPRCPSCGAPILRQLVGDRAALTVTADPRPLTPAEQTELRGPNRLIWCLPDARHVSRRLRWISRWHPPNCPHDHLADHKCPQRHPARLF